MMTHEFGHVECGGAGEELGLKQIWVHDHEVLNIANHMKHENLIAKYGATEKQALAIGKMIAADVAKWKKTLKQKYGVPYYTHEPDPRNK